MSSSRSPAVAAIVHLRGHRATAAYLEVTQFPLLAWTGRIVLYVLGWLASTWLTLIITFDPFVAAFPFVIGMGLVYRTVRGRFHVKAFQGVCPRCAGDLQLEVGSKIPLPHPLVCYNCHHEPELRVLRADSAPRHPRSG